MVENHFHSNSNVENVNQPHDHGNFVHSSHEKSILKSLSRDLEVLPIDLSIHKSNNHRFRFKTIAHIVNGVMKNRCRKLTWEEIQAIKSHEKYSLEIKKIESASLKFQPKVEGRSIRIENESVITF